MPMRMMRMLSPSVPALLRRFSNVFYLPQLLLEFCLSLEAGVCCWEQSINWRHHYEQSTSRMQQTFHHWASWSVLYTQCFAFDLSKLWCTRFALKKQNMSTTKKYSGLVCQQVEIWTSTFCACSRTLACQHAACSSIASTVFYLPNLCLTSPRVLSHQGSAIVRQNTWHAWVFRLEFAVMNRASIEDTTTNEDPADVSTEPASWALVVRALDTQLFSCVLLPSTAKDLWHVLKWQGVFAGKTAVQISKSQYSRQSCEHKNTGCLMRRGPDLETKHVSDATDLSPLS